LTLGGSNVTIAITKITAARAAAVIIAGAAIAACAAPAPRPAATAAAKRAAKPAAPPALTTAQGAKICRDLNAWLAGAWNEKEPRFNSQLESDETEAGYTALGSDLMTLDWNLVNFNSAALQNTPPNYYPVTGLTALQHDCAGYGVSLKVPSG
jgi:ABC-type glycerol-3-phosphate transport system substrate-binding protein